MVASPSFHQPTPAPQPRLTDEQIRELEGLPLRWAKAPVQETWHRKGRISAISDVTISPVLRRSDLVFRLLPNDAHAHGQENFARVGPTHRRAVSSV